MKNCDTNFTSTDTLMLNSAIRELLGKGEVDFGWYNYNNINNMIDELKKATPKDYSLNIYEILFPKQTMAKKFRATIKPY
jgi:hypothetical protein